MSPTIKKVTNPSASEIDDIFTRKAGTETLKTNQHDSSSGLKKKKRKKNTTKTQVAEPKRSAPEIVVDPSSSTQRPTSKSISHEHPAPPRKKQKIVETKFDQDKFRDSRGTGPRRKTDEGFNVYKEDELGINPEAGGTSSCPFDCNCCF